VKCECDEYIEYTPCLNAPKVGAQVPSCQFEYSLCTRYIEVLWPGCVRGHLANRGQRNVYVYRLYRVYVPLPPPFIPFDSVFHSVAQRTPTKPKRNVNPVPPIIIAIQKHILNAAPHKSTLAN